MYFLNGDRLYIKPEKACGNIEEQLENCLNQLKTLNAGKKIFKINFFVDAKTDEDYTQLQQDISGKININVHEEIIVNLIAQPPLTCKILLEVFLYDPLEWEKKSIEAENGKALLFQKQKTLVLIGSTQSYEKNSCKENSQNAFESLGMLLKSADFQVNSIVRQWNYLQYIIGFEGERQKYQEFNDVRSDFYAHHFDKSGFPAATGIGTKQGGILIEFVAVKSEQIITKPVDNPEQISAHHYSENVLVGEECSVKTTPKFERARYFQLFDKKLIFISGTASIVGEKTVGVGDAEKQTEITIQNIQRLYSDTILEKLSTKKLNPKYGHARVYVKNRKDFPVIKKTFKKYFGKLQVVYIIADICRPDLLVEIEGKVVLE